MDNNIDQFLNTNAWKEGPEQMKLLQQAYSDKLAFMPMDDLSPLTELVEQDGEIDLHANYTIFSTEGNAKAYPKGPLGSPKLTHEISYTQRRSDKLSMASRPTFFTETSLLTGNEFLTRYANKAKKAIQAQIGDSILGRLIGKASVINNAQPGLVDESLILTGLKTGPTEKIAHENEAMSYEKVIEARNIALKRKVWNHQEASQWRLILGRAASLQLAKSPMFLNTSYNSGGAVLSTGTVEMVAGVGIIYVDNIPATGNIETGYLVKKGILKGTSFSDFKNDYWTSKDIEGNPMIIESILYYAMVRMNEDEIIPIEYDVTAKPKKLPVSV